MIHNVVDDASKAFPNRRETSFRCKSIRLWFAAARTILLPRFHGARHLPLRLHVARGIRHERSSYCQTVITVGSEAIDSLKLVFSSVTKAMADSQLRFYGVVREKRG